MFRPFWVPVLFLTLAASPFAIPSAFAVNWTDRARRLTGESVVVRNAEIKALRKTPGIESTLRAAFGTRDQFLAFDVIVALGMTSLIPDLMRFTVRDSSGYSYHTLNAIASGANRAKVLALYRKQIQDPKLAPIAKMTVLDSLSRTGERIASEDLDRLLSDAVPEVRASAIDALRRSILRSGRADDVRRVSRMLGDPADRLRLQTLSIFDEIPPGRRKALGAPVAEFLSPCREDSVEEIRTLCLRLIEEYSE
jgi:HEAT repeat protein